MGTDLKTKREKNRRPELSKDKYIAKLLGKEVENVPKVDQEMTEPKVEETETGQSSEISETKATEDGKKTWKEKGEDLKQKGEQISAKISKSVEKIRSSKMYKIVNKGVNKVKQLVEKGQEKYEDNQIQIALNKELFEAVAGSHDNWLEWKEGGDQELIEDLIKEGALLKYYSKSGNNAFHEACSKG